jgi:hypothetical protein
MVQQDQGVINYTRGVIQITNMPKLKGLSRECYETLRSETPNDAT